MLRRRNPEKFPLAAKSGEFENDSRDRPAPAQNEIYAAPQRGPAPPAAEYAASVGMDPSLDRAPVGRRPPVLVFDRACVT